MLNKEGVCKVNIYSHSLAASQTKEKPFLSLHSVPKEFIEPIDPYDKINGLSLT